MRIRRMTAPPDVREVDEKIAEVRLKKESAIDGQDFELAARLRDEERQLQEERGRREQTWKAGEMDVLSEIDEEEIAEVLSVWTGIPVFKLTEEETEKLLRMEDELHRRIISQEEAISAVSRAMRRTRSGLKDPRRPSGSFIFLGPSGVGKTELSKALAEFLFGDEDALIQLDMSEFHDQYTVSRLIGSPPGYVGYDEGGQLTEAVRRKPFSVVLFDEIEKAHPNVFDTLLQILEDGHLTDGQGRTVDFKNTIIIMTSNLGTRDIQKGMSVGFASNVDQGGDYERMKGKVEEELKKSFRPEFINRIDEVIVFHSLTTDDVKQIVDLLMRRVEEQLKAKDVDIELTDAAKTLPGRARLGPGAGRTAAAPHHPAARRGPACREAPAQGVPCRRDDPDRRGRRRDRLQLDDGVRAARHPARGTRWFARVGEPRSRPLGGIKAEARPHLGTGLLGIWESYPACQA